MTRGIILGAVAVIILALVGAYLAVLAGLIPANADSKPSPLERWAAGKSLRATIHRQISLEDPNPLPVTDANLDAGIKLYAANCAACHGAADAKMSNVASGLYQRAPQLARHGVEDDAEAETYWKIEHGIRFTGMPSFGDSFNKQQIWQLTMLLKHMDSLPPKPAATFKKLPSQATKQRKQSAGM
ncbi:MAG: c-type cytochrome [Candidatus Eremiobacteraeota bacterium]|nr:c-type cytochrome [Candidatus Eremiobacteraeota bacterium]